MVFWKTNCVFGCWKVVSCFPGGQRSLKQLKNSQKISKLHFRKKKCVEKKMRSNAFFLRQNWACVFHVEMSWQSTQQKTIHPVEIYIIRIFFEKHTKNLIKLTFSNELMPCWPSTQDQNFKPYKDLLVDKLGSAVEFASVKGEKGKIVIHFDDKPHLADILEKLRHI